MGTGGVLFLVTVLEAYRHPLVFPSPLLSWKAFSAMSVALERKWIGMCLNLGRRLLGLCGLETAPGAVASESPQE